MNESAHQYGLREDILGPGQRNKNGRVPDESILAAGIIGFQRKGYIPRFQVLLEAIDCDCKAGKRGE